MLKKTALTISLLLATVSSGHTQFIVSDPELIAEFLVEIEEIYKQVQAAQDQLAKAKQMYESVTGNRNFGDLFSKDNIDKLMPQDMQGLYSDLNKNGISGPVESILNAEKLNGSVDEMSKAISDRQKRSAAAQKALGEKAFEAAQQRLDEIENLRKEIAKTGDQKAIGELQARLQVEQAAIQSETNKLELLQQMQENEDKFIQMQNQAINQKIFNKNNTDMPKIN